MPGYETYDLTPGGSGGRRRDDRSRRSRAPSPPDLGHDRRRDDRSSRSRAPSPPDLGSDCRLRSVAVGESSTGVPRLYEIPNYPTRPSAGRRPSILDARRPSSVSPSMYDVYGEVPRNQPRASSRAPTDSAYYRFEVPGGREPREPHFVPSVSRQPLFGNDRSDRNALSRRLSSTLPPAYNNLRAAEDREWERHEPRGGREPAPSHWPSYGDGTRYNFDPQRRDPDQLNRASSRYGLYDGRDYTDRPAPRFGSVHYGTSEARSSRRRSTRDESPLGGKYSRHR